MYRVLVLLLAGCSFGGSSIGPLIVDAAEHDAPVIDAVLADAMLDAAPDAMLDAMVDAPPIDALVSVCGNGIVEPGEACEIGTVTACASPSPCNDPGVAACTNNCQLDACRVTVDPATAWEVSSNTTSWTGVTLPDTSYPCDNCTRYYRTTICGRPKAVEFRWSSDNRARMRINTTTAFDQFWLTNYCTDAPCCTKCCDSMANCLAHLSGLQTLDDGDLTLFTTGTNTMRWEVGEEVGGSGFYSLMTLSY